MRRLKGCGSGRRRGLHKARYERRGIDLYLTRCHGDPLNPAPVGQIRAPFLWEGRPVFLRRMSFPCGLKPRQWAARAAALARDAAGRSRTTLAHRKRKCPVQLRPPGLGKRRNRGYKSDAGLRYSHAVNPVSRLDKPVDKCGYDTRGRWLGRRALVSPATPQPLSIMRPCRRGPQRFLL